MFAKRAAVRGHDTSSECPTEVQTSFVTSLKTAFIQAVHDSHVLPEQYSTVGATRCNGTPYLHLPEVQGLPAGGGSCQGEVLLLIHRTNAYTGKQSQEKARLLSIN